MNVKITNQELINGFLKNAAGYNSAEGNPRAKEVVHRILVDICKMMDDLNITPSEFWVAMNYLIRLGKANEPALLAAGLGLERILDMRQDEYDRQLGLLHKNATPRVIEGPLYVAGAPVCEVEARMDDGKDTKTAPMYLHGQVRDVDGKPIAHATVEVWHANGLGNYSYFDKTQSNFNLRRTIKTDAQGQYVARSIVPSGYGCPLEGPTQELLNAIGRHGNRPAHIHFFVYAPKYSHLTTQINLDGDPYLHDDFAFATRDEVVAKAIRIDDPTIIATKKMNGDHFYDVEFNFVLAPANSADKQDKIERKRAVAVA